MSNNEMFSMPRDLAKRIISDSCDAEGAGEVVIQRDDWDELSALLAAPEPVWNPHPAEANLAALLILLAQSGVKVTGGIGDEPWSVDPAAQPVPPAGGEPLIHINPAVLSMLRGGLKAAPGGITFSLSEPVGGWTVPLYEQHVVSRLQAEVETLRAALRTEVEAGDSWKREALELRELLAMPSDPVEVVPADSLEEALTLLDFALAFSLCNMHHEGTRRDVKKAQAHFARVRELMPSQEALAQGARNVEVEKQIADQWEAKAQALQAELDALKAQPQGEPVHQWSDDDGVSWCDGNEHSLQSARASGWKTRTLYCRPPAPQGSPVAAIQKYDDTLLPFLALMRKELHANVGKGDRHGWLAMSSDTCLLEIFYHLGKLQKAVKNSDANGMAEYAADVANMCMMLLDICGALAFVEPPAPVAVVLPLDADKAFKEWASALPSPPSAFYAYLAGIAEVARLNSL